MAWIESHQEVRDHPKTLALGHQMEWDLDTTIAKLHRFWWWCLSYAVSGDLRPFNDAQLALAIGLNTTDASKFVSAMVSCGGDGRSGFIERDPYFRLHNWWRYVGRYLQTRYKNEPMRWQSIRDSYNRCNNPPNNTPKPQNQPTNQPNQPTNDVGADDDLDNAIRAYIGGHRLLTYDMAGHAKLRKLVEISGWDAAKSEVEAAIAKGVGMPLGYALATASAKQAQADIRSQPPPVDAEQIQRENAEAMALAKRNMAKYGRR
jgi:hypothetical protein